MVRVVSLGCVMRSKPKPGDIMVWDGKTPPSLYGSQFPIPFHEPWYGPLGYEAVHFRVKRENGVILNVIPVLPKDSYPVRLPS